MISFRWMSGFSLLIRFFNFFCLSYVNESKHANNTWLIAFISITMRLETTLPSTDKVLNNRLWILCKLLMQVSFWVFESVSINNLFLFFVFVGPSVIWLQTFSASLALVVIRILSLLVKHDKSVSLSNFNALHHY